MKLRVLQYGGDDFLLTYKLPIFKIPCLISGICSKHGNTALAKVKAADCDCSYLEP